MSVAASEALNSSQGPHDRFTRHGFRDPDIALGLVRFCLQDFDLSLLDLQQVEFLSYSAVDPRLKETISDGMFKIPFAQEEGFLCICVEHKSDAALRSPECNLIFQLRRQELLFMSECRDNHPEGLMPIVILVGLVHGKKPYRGPLTVAEKIQGPRKYVPERWKTNDMVLIDLNKLPDEELACGGKFGVYLMLLKHIYDPNLEETFQKLLPELTHLQNNQSGRDFITSVMTYIVHASPAEKGDKLIELAVQSMSEEVGGTIMTIAEQLMKKGADAANQAAAATLAATLAAERRRFALNLQKKGYSLQDIAETMEIPLERVTELVQPVAS